MNNQYPFDTTSNMPDQMIGSAPPAHGSADGPEDTIVSDSVRRYTAQWGLPQPTPPIPEPNTYQELIECWKQKASDAVEKFRHQPFDKRDTELWGLYVAYNNAAAQLTAVMNQQNKELRHGANMEKSKLVKDIEAVESAMENRQAKAPLSPATGSESPWDFACKWYRESEIEHFLGRQKQHLLSDNDSPIPHDIYSPEFAAWLTNQYRLAMNKGIQIGREWKTQNS